MTSGDQIRNPYNTYRPDMLSSWVLSPESFQRSLPGVVHQFLDATPLTTSSSEAIQAYGNMLGGLSKYYNNGHKTLKYYFYREYAHANGLVERREFLGKTLTGAIDIPNLSDEQTSAWEAHLYTMEIPREKAVEAFKPLTYLDMPSVKYIEDPFVGEMHKRLSTVPFQLAETLLPDISDEEARSLFGQLTSAEDVHVQAVDY